jgi:formylglycine-generating enzyme required for sulfatase activity
MRHTADWSRFNEEQQELLKRFDRWRLIVHKGEAEGGTVEVAHEALFRTWKRLENWLEPERERLEVLCACQVDAGNWERAAKSDGFLNHRKKRLSEALSLSVDTRYAARLASRDFAYLAACQAAERAAQGRARRGKMLIAALGLLVMAAGFGIWKIDFLRDKYQWHVTMDGHARADKSLVALADKPVVEHRFFKDCDFGCPEMVVVPAGQFMMGSPKGEKDGHGDEAPQHEVTISKPYAVGKFTVTFAEWDVCAAAAACPKAKDEGWGRENRPVINVSWDDAKQYVAWLSRVSGKSYRLLTEAEWEYAARAGTSTAYYWGDEIGSGNANCDGCGSERGRNTTLAGSFKGNAFGLHDMAGNVWQWVEDCHAGYAGGPSDGSANTTTGCVGRVLRGGSWNGNPQFLRAAFRLYDSPFIRYRNTGFRVARTLSPQ